MAKGQPPQVVCDHQTHPMKPRRNSTKFFHVLAGVAAAFALIPLGDAVLVAILNDRIPVAPLVVGGVCLVAAGVLFFIPRLGHRGGTGIFLRFKNWTLRLGVKDGVHGHGGSGKRYSIETRNQGERETARSVRTGKVIDSELRQQKSKKNSRGARAINKKVSR